MGVARFERAISASQTQNHTKLDHAPSEQKQLPKFKRDRLLLQHVRKLQ